MRRRGSASTVSETATGDSEDDDDDDDDDDVAGESWTRQAPFLQTPTFDFQLHKVRAHSLHPTMYTRTMHATSERTNGRTDERTDKKRTEANDCATPGWDDRADELTLWCVCCAFVMSLPGLLACDTSFRTDAVRSAAD